MLLSPALRRRKGRSRIVVRAPGLAQSDDVRGEAPTQAERTGAIRADWNDAACGVSSCCTFGEERFEQCATFIGVETGNQLADRNALWWCQSCGQRGRYARNGTPAVCNRLS
jgi:hypothetical protein